jgi:NDP-sugar pyrophosphorylase family protein
MGKVEEIGKYAFTLTNITSVNIADGMIIGEGAFSYCPLLATVKIGNNVTIGNYAFRSAGDYASTPVQVEGQVYYYYPVVGSNLKSLTIGEGAKIGDYAFWFSTELTEATVGAGAEIGKYAFYGSSKLERLNGLDKATSIGDSAFSGDVYYAMELADLGAYALMSTVKVIASGNVKRYKQDDSKSTYAKKIEKNPEKSLCYKSDLKLRDSLFDARGSRGCVFDSGCDPVRR